MFENIGKNILITGGAGFIGSHLSEKLMELGHNIIIIDSFNDYYDPNLKEKNVEIVSKTAEKFKVKYKVYRGDIRNFDFMKKMFEENNIDGIVHLAANAGVRPSIENPQYYVEVNLNGLTNLLECMRLNDLHKLVFISSSSVYGNNKKVPFSEKDAVDNPISPYAATKKAGELLCYTYHHLFNINVACLRYFTVYGPRQRPDLAINKFTRLMLEDKPIPMYGDGSTARDYTYVSDIVDGTIRALNYISRHEKIYDIFNLGGSNPITLKELIEVIGNAIGKTPKIEQLAMQPGDVEITYSDFSHAKEILKYNPQVKLVNGINDFVKWYTNGLFK